MIRPFRYVFVVSFLLIASSASAQQRPDFSKLIEAMDKEGCVVHQESGVKVCKRDFSVDGKNVEAISFEPRGGGKFPGCCLFPVTRRLHGIGFPMV